MSKYKTAMGKVVDISQLASQNERVRAVGNTPMNARGDVIDSQGKVVVPVTVRTGTRYQATVAPKVSPDATPIANPTPQAIPPSIIPDVQHTTEIVPQEITEAESAYEAEWEEEAALLEEIKAVELNKPVIATKSTPTKKPTTK